MARLPPPGLPPGLVKPHLGIEQRTCRGLEVEVVAVACSLEPSVEVCERQILRRGARPAGLRSSFMEEVVGLSLIFVTLHGLLHSRSLNTALVPSGGTGGQRGGGGAALSASLSNLLCHRHKLATPPDDAHAHDATRLPPSRLPDGRLFLCGRVLGVGRAGRQPPRGRGTCRVVRVGDGGSISGARLVRNGRMRQERTSYGLTKAPRPRLALTVITAS